MVNELAGYRPADFAQSELYGLINSAIGARLSEKKGGMPNLHVRKQLLERIGHEIDPDQLVMPVFIAYLEQAMGANLAEQAAEARALAAVQWLSGETIDPDLARMIGLRINAEDGARIEDDVAVQRTLDVVCRLCACANRPFVLCLDQVDNLSRERVLALTSFLHAAIDNGHNLVVVTSGVKESMDRLEREVIPTAAADRIAQHRVKLDFISTKDAGVIVTERLAKFCAPYAKVKQVAAARATDPFAPLSRTWWQDYANRFIETRPRDVIRAARDAWEAEQARIAELGSEAWVDSLGAPGLGTPPPPLRPLEERIDEVVLLKFTEAVNSRRLNPARLPPDADNIATLAVTLLEGCLAVPTYTLRSLDRPTSGKTAPYQLCATEELPDGRAVTNGLLFFTNDNAVSATHALKRLHGDESPPTHQYLVTDEERRPLRLGAKGREVYDALLHKPSFKHVKLGFEHHAQLDAMSSVLGAARVGDLEIETQKGVYRAITEDECRDALHRKQVLLSHPLLRELLTEEGPPTSQEADVKDSVVEQVRAQIKGELALALSMTAREMTTIIISRTSQPDSAAPKIWEIVKKVARQMHEQRQLFVDAENDDLFMQLA